ncbi:MAG: hypothetical protein M0P69_15110 [Bacteroidales bacterium]|nr:hypothetical protein [Bacteroidales bacterium]
MLFCVATQDQYSWSQYELQNGQVVRTARCNYPVGDNHGNGRKSIEFGGRRFASVEEAIAELKKNEHPAVAYRYVDHGTKEV